jgi:hypothetical protein
LNFTGCLSREKWAKPAGLHCLAGEGFLG